MDSANNFKNLSPMMKQTYGKMPKIPKPKGIQVSMSTGGSQQSIGSLTPTNNPQAPDLHIGIVKEPGIAPHVSIASKVPNENFVSNNPYRLTQINRIDKFPRLFKVSKI